MRRFVTLLVLFLSSISFGVSVTGCSHNAAPTFCNGGDSGMVTTQAATITLQPVLTGVSLNFAEIGQLNTPTTTDCKGTSVAINAYTWGITDATVADIQPTTGRLCGGTWNRNTGGGIPDFTVCTPNNKSGIAYVTASANGVTSNPIPIFVHPVVTSVVLGGAPPGSCSTDPTTLCAQDATQSNGCSRAPVSTTTPFYTGKSCISQGTTAQLYARVFAGDPTIPTNNISCFIGHLQYTTQGAASTTAISTVLSVDQNGVATANQPGSVLISANISNAASSAGIFSTCPPASITLSTPGTTGSPVVVNENTPQPIVATVSDTLGATLTGLSLEYVSTVPSTVSPSAGGSVTPSFAGAASISAICQPPSCNSSAYNQIGLFGNGLPVTSNSVNITTPGTNGTVLYMASTSSQEIVQMDFTTGVISAPFLLPYVPNSMFISNDGTTIYMGSPLGLMTLTVVNKISLSGTDVSSPGTILALAPNGSTMVISDPIRQTTTIRNTSGGTVSSFGGVGTRAEFAPDSQTVYITAGDQILVYSAYTGWTNILQPTAVTDVAITVPSVGAYFAGSTTTARGYCPASGAPITTNGVTSISNSFYPPADNAAATTDRIAATNDGLHILGATVTPVPTLNDIQVKIPIGACPPPATTNGPTPGLIFKSTPSSKTLTPVTATAIDGVIPASDSSIAFITYTGSGGVLPAYAPAASGLGLTSYIKLSNNATAPLAGVFSSDNSTFYVGTQGDNLVHLINRSTLTDSSTINPNLVTPAGTTVPVNLIVQKPRSTT